MERAKKLVDIKYGNRDCIMISDWRNLLANKEIDAVMIATPDHWHSLMAVEAAKAGKDMYCEKPMGLSLADGQHIRTEVRKHKRIFQAGTQQRSDGNFRQACELARNGYLGKIHTVEVSTEGPKFKTNYTGSMDPQPIPEGFDWKMWLGPAPEVPYNPGRHSSDWFLINDYSTGFIVNWGIHHLDIALWGCPELGTTPFEIECAASYRNEVFTDNVYSWDATFNYSNGLKMVFKDQYKMKTGIRFIGDKGWVHVDRGFLDASMASLLDIKPKVGDTNLYRSQSHHQNFVDCIKSRIDPVSDVDSTHKASYMGLLADIAGRTKQKLTWDPSLEQFVNNEEANKLLNRKMHNGWKI